MNGLENDQIIINANASVSSASNINDFFYKRAHANAKDLYNKFKFDRVNNRDEFIKSLKLAEKELQ